MHPSYFFDYNIGTGNIVMNRNPMAQSDLISEQRLYHWALLCVFITFFFFLNKIK